MAAAPPPLSVVVPTYQRQRLVSLVVVALLQDPASAEVIVVVDGSTDGTADVLEAMAADQPRLRVILQSNAGRQAARRAGIAAAVSDHVLLVDDDVRARPGLVSAHAAQHCVPGLVVEGYMPVVLPGSRSPGLAGTYLYAANYETHCREVELDSGLVLRQLWGGNVSLGRIEALAVADGPEFPASFGEDTHFGLLCARRGLTGRFERTARADHLHSRTLPQFLRDSDEQGAGRWWLHRLYPDELGPLDPDDFLQDLPGPVPGTVRWVTPRAGRFLPPLAGLAARAAAAAGRFGTETQVARLARRMALYRGASRAAASWEAGFRPGGWS